MAETLNVKTRESRGKREAKRLRSAGTIPAILYGHGEANRSLSLSAEEMASYWADMAGKYPIVSIEDGMDEEDWDGWKALTEKIKASTAEVEKEDAEQKNPDIKFAKRPDGTLKTKNEYTTDEWKAYTGSVIDSKLKETEPEGELEKSKKDLAGFRNIAPDLVRRAEKATSLEDFIKAGQKQRPDLSAEDLTGLWNRITPALEAENAPTSAPAPEQAGSPTAIAAEAKQGIAPEPARKPAAQDKAVAPKISKPMTPIRERAAKAAKELYKPAVAAKVAKTEKPSTDKWTPLFEGYKRKPDADDVRIADTLLATLPQHDFNVIAPRNSDLDYHVQQVKYVGDGVYDIGGNRSSSPEKLAVFMRMNAMAPTTAPLGHHKASAYQAPATQGEKDWDAVYAPDKKPTAEKPASVEKPKEATPAEKIAAYKAKKAAESKPSAPVKSTFGGTEAAVAYVQGKLREEPISQIKADLFRLFRLSPKKIDAVIEEADPKEDRIEDAKAMVMELTGGEGVDNFAFTTALAQELAHAEIDRGHNDYSRSHYNFQAYCAAYMLCKKFGVETASFRFGRVHERLKELEPQHIRAELTVMKDAAHDISRRMHRMLAQQRQQQPNRSDSTR